MSGRKGPGGRDGALIEILAAAAIAMPWPADEVEARLMAWSRDAVDAAITIEPVPAPPPDVSVVLSDNRFLTARRRFGDPPFSDQERRLLVALGSMATTSRHAARREAQLRRQALTDELTGLWHAHYFRELLEEVADTRFQERIGVLFLDVDRFKQLNEQLGHLDADEVLREIGRRIDDSLPDDSIVARTGGDEFAAVVRHLDDLAHLDRIVATLRSDVSAPLSVNDLLISVDVSVGSSLSVNQTDDPERLLREAERAMRRNKRSRPDPAPPRWYDERTALSEMLDQGLVEVAFQPLVDLDRVVATAQSAPEATGRPGTRREDAALIGYEALVRGRHLEFGPVSPMVLVGAASRLRMLDELTEVVLDQAVPAVGAAARALGRRLALSVNVEFEQLRPESGLIQSLAGRLEGYDVGLVLEISERQVGRWIPSQVLAARALAEAGIGLAVDDFGAGWSALGMLNSWTWQWVKLDRSLVTQRAGEPGRKLLGHVARMLTDLDLTALAEGIETPEELATVRETGVRLAQGHLLGPPVPVDRLPGQGAPVEAAGSQGPGRGDVSEVAPTVVP